MNSFTMAGGGALLAMALALGACDSGADVADEPTGALASPIADAAGPAPDEDAGEDQAVMARQEQAEAAEDGGPVPTPSPSASTRPSPAAAASPVAAAAMGPPPAFAQCRVCHSVDPGENGLGPSLAGVFGAKAGHLDSFTYSLAMTQSGLTWNAPTLDRYLENPQAAVPGTTMAYPGVRNEAQRKAIVDYLKTL